MGLRYPSHGIHVWSRDGSRVRHPGQAAVRNARVAFPQVPEQAVSSRSGLELDEDCNPFPTPSRWLAVDHAPRQPNLADYLPRIPSHVQRMRGAGRVPEVSLEVTQELIKAHKRGVGGSSDTIASKELSC